MSKSSTSEKGVVYLLDPPGQIEKKFKSAVTDSGTDIRHDRADKPGVSNLLEIMAAATGRGVDDLAAEYDGHGYGTFKAAVADAVIELLRPVRERHEQLATDPGEVSRQLTSGADKARDIASDTLRRAKDAMGLLAPGPSPTSGLRA
jgi:tryptophanyl-tRNA synthetase